MAEGILKSVAGDLIDVQSAGSDPAGYVHPLSIKALDEIGIDISANTSKHMNQFLEQDVETVITVCGMLIRPARLTQGNFVATTGRFRPGQSRRFRRGNLGTVSVRARRHFPGFSAYGQGRLDSVKA